MKAVSIFAFLISLLTCETSDLRYLRPQLGQLGFSEVQAVFPASDAATATPPSFAPTKPPRTKRDKNTEETNEDETDTEVTRDAEEDNQDETDTEVNQDNTSSGVDYAAVAADIAAMIRENRPLGPTLVRLAWHSSGTYDKDTNTGGSGGGTIRFKEELDHGNNAGLAKVVEALEPIREKYAADGLSYADLFTLVGVVAIKELGGPTIGWSSGRVDEPVEAVTPDGRLPNADVGASLADRADADHLRTIFYRMGLNDQEIVVLSGAHGFGRCHEDASGFSGQWTTTPTIFNNNYYFMLRSLEWVPKQWSGPPQYVDAGRGFVMMLPSDVILLEDSTFKQWVDVYANSKSTFFADFAVAFQKLEELGTSGLTPTEWWTYSS